MNGVVDRIENNYAVVELEDKKIINIKLDTLPKGIKEGDVINIEKCITINKEETERKKAEISKEIEDMWK